MSSTEVTAAKGAQRPQRERLFARGRELDDAIDVEVERCVLAFHGGDARELAERTDVGAIEGQGALQGGAGLDRTATAAGIAVKEHVAEEVPGLDVVGMLCDDGAVALLRQGQATVQPRVLRLEHALRAGGERATQGIGGATGLPRGHEHRGGGARAGEAIVGQREAGVELHGLLEGGHGAGVPAEAEIVLALQECLERGPGAAGARGELRGIGAGRLAQEGDKASREFIDDAEESVLTRRLGLHPPDACRDRCDGARR